MSLEPKEFKLGAKETIAVISVITLSFFLVLFGITGARTIIAIPLFFFLPFYLILNNFELPAGEKIVFSFFIGLGIFSSFVYYISILVSSVRIAIAITFVILIAAAFLIKRLKKKYSK